MRRVPSMATAPVTKTPVIDPVTGLMRNMSDEERRERSEALQRALDEIATITDETDTDEIWDDVFRGLKAARPESAPAEETP